MDEMSLGALALIGTVIAQKKNISMCIIYECVALLWLFSAVVLQLSMAIGPKHYKCPRVLSLIDMALCSLPHLAE